MTIVSRNGASQTKTSKSTYEKVKSFGFKAAAVALTLFVQGTVARAQDKATAVDPIKQCDVMASHPHDPGRFAAGVPDDQLAPGAAVPVCKAAVAVTALSGNESYARESFQLGRILLSAQKYQDAFASFKAAAEKGYAPAMKFVGDAYITGQGLPDGEQPNAKTADEWYQKSEQGGFADAKTAREELKATIEKTQFDPSAFQNPDFISALYNNTAVSGSKSEVFFIYAGSLAQELGGEQILFLDQSCKSLIKPSTTVAYQNYQRLYWKKYSDMDVRDAVNSLRSGGAMTRATDVFVFNADQGHRDAVNVMKRYGCASEIAKTIADNIAARFSPSWRPAAGNIQQPTTPSTDQPQFEKACKSKEDKAYLQEQLKIWQRKKGQGAFAISEACEYLGTSWNKPDQESARSSALNGCQKQGARCKVIYEMQ